MRRGRNSRQNGTPRCQANVGVSLYGARTVFLAAAQSSRAKQGTSHAPQLGFVAVAWTAHRPVPVCIVSSQCQQNDS